MRLTRHLDQWTADIAIAPSGGRSDLEARYLYRWELRVFGRDVPPSAAPITLDEVAQHPILITPAGHRSRDLLDEAARTHGLKLNVHLELADHGVMLELARKSDWWAVIPSDAFGFRTAQQGEVDQGRAISTTEVRKAKSSPTQTLGDSFDLFYRQPDESLRDAEFERRVADAVEFIVARLAQ